MQDVILDWDSGIYRITCDGKVYSRPKRKIPLVGKGMEFTGEFKHILGDERELWTTVNNRGYRAVRFNKKTFMVHRLVAEYFCSESKTPERLYVNHIDGNKLNNSYTNLEWCTAAENSKHARDTGLHIQPKGYKLNYKSEDTKKKALSNLKVNTVLSDDTVRYCRSVYIPRHPEFGASALAREYGVSNVAMSNAIKGITFVHVK